MTDEFRPNSPQFALDHFDPLRQSYARELRGLSKRELAERIGKTPSAVSQFESGSIKPDLDTFLRIALSLGLPPGFFAHQSNRRQPIALDQCNFRALRSATQRDRRQSVRMAELLLDLIQHLMSLGVVFPTEQVSPNLTSATSREEIEKTADGLRRAWGMGLGPIAHMARLLESKGILVLPVYRAKDSIGAFSTWSDGRPLVILTQRKTASRGRFDAAHELGHLILHEDASPGAKSTEKQADHFAGAFLMPRSSFELECPRKWNYGAFRAVADRWRVSIQAAVVRATQLSIISDYSYRKAFIEISSRGERTTERESISLEQPTLIQEALELLLGEIRLSEIAVSLGISEAELVRAIEPCVSAELIEELSAPVTHDGNLVRLNLHSRNFED